MNCFTGQFWEMYLRSIFFIALPSRELLMALTLPEKYNCQICFKFLELNFGNWKCKICQNIDFLWPNHPVHLRDRENLCSGMRTVAVNNTGNKLWEYWNSGTLPATKSTPKPGINRSMQRTLKLAIAESALCIVC